MNWIWGTLGGIAIVAVLTTLRRWDEVFLLSVRHGQTLVVRGRINPRLRNDVAEVVRGAGVLRATVRVFRRGDAVRLTVHGAEDRVAQRLRNAFGLYSPSQITAGSGGSRRNVGQVLGWAWLAWLLTWGDP